MKKRQIVIVLTLIVSGHASALELKNYSFGIEKYNENYLDYESGEKFMQENSMMTSIIGEANLYFNEDATIWVSGRYAKGKSDYTGAYTNGVYGDLKVKGINRESWEIQTILKHEFNIESLGSFTIGPGLGLRHLKDSLDQASSGGYTRKNDLSYAIISISKEFDNKGIFKITPSVAYKKIIKGKQHSAIEEGVDNIQKNGYGFDINLAIEKKIYQRSLYVTPFYRFWKIKRSDPAIFRSSTVFEPENTTKEVGLKIGIQF
ncbi:hypothetical protein [Vogesella urethralis]|uniref:Outer membrane protein beta-barrel domain-containing protein n=1 Tax=Reticulomyxa filosa TaxID=46433 RepID=X6MY51_RETFI|nr:hypothetical protein [Vogesella urethralis]ETO18010.1 hypothetical protein RFI_19285 [Reticulomyxa filosa]|eukprot:ETO18010.1 hypothetical protein RFI_19285 [Reticulomyxa filosa]